MAVGAERKDLVEADDARCVGGTAASAMSAWAAWAWLRVAIRAVSPLESQDYMVARSRTRRWPGWRVSVVSGSRSSAVDCRLSTVDCRLPGAGGMLEQFTIAGTGPALNSRTGGHPMNKTAAGK